MKHLSRSKQRSDDWHTPRHIFDALGCRFDLDVAASHIGPRYVPADAWIHEGSLEREWCGFIWMNPPFGGRNGLEPWLRRFFEHGNGIALTPDRTSAPWWQDAARRCHMLLFVGGKVKFERPDGSIGNKPGNGVTLFAAGEKAVTALSRASAHGLGWLGKRGTLD